MKKSFIALLIIIFLSSLITFTTPSLLKKTRIGLEFKGGYEILYVAEPTQQLGNPPIGNPPNQADLLKTASILNDRANSLGVAEPEVIIEGNNQIRVKLAGVSSGEEVRKILNQSGNLPVKLTEKYSETVGGVLGQEDFHNTIRAGAIAFGLILGFMGLIYRIPGLIAIFALINYLWLLLVVFNLLHATLSLAAIFFGLICGAYSSIFIAAPLWLLLKQKALPSLEYKAINGN